jgi:hypothetical protein
VVPRGAMRARSWRFGGLLTATLLVVGCTPPQEGHLVRVSEAATLSLLRVDDPRADSSNAHANLPDGDSCEGRAARTRASEIEDVDGPTSETGVAILLCRSRTVLRCRLLYRPDHGYVSGHCVTQHGAAYNVRFDSLEGR